MLNSLYKTFRRINPSDNNNKLAAFPGPGFPILSYCPNALDWYVKAGIRKIYHKKKSLR